MIFIKFCKLGSGSHRQTFLPFNFALSSQDVFDSPTVLNLQNLMKITNPLLSKIINFPTGSKYKHSLTLAKILL